MRQASRFLLLVFSLNKSIPQTKLNRQSIKCLQSHQFKLKQLTWNSNTISKFPNGQASTTKLVTVLQTQNLRLKHAIRKCTTWWLQYAFCLSVHFGNLHIEMLTICFLWGKCSNKYPWGIVWFNNDNLTQVIEYFFLFKFIDLHYIKNTVLQRWKRRGLKCKWKKMDDGYNFIMNSILSNDGPKPIESYFLSTNTTGSDDVLTDWSTKRNNIRRI